MQQFVTRHVGVALTSIVSYFYTRYSTSMDQTKQPAKPAIDGSMLMELDSDPTDLDTDRLSSSRDTEPPWTQIEAASSQLSLRFKSQDDILGADEPNPGHSWDDPLRRASRWRDDDSSDTFYVNILKDLALPTTRSREVARWRIKRRVIQANKDGDPLPVPLPAYPHLHSDGDEERFVQEQPSGELRSQRAYDVIMRAWLSIRRPYPTLTPTPDPVVREHMTPPSHYCTNCRRKLRLCRCNACHKCGELFHQCLCQRCSGCNQHNSDCSCKPAMKQKTEEKELVPYRTRQWIAANSTTLPSNRSPHPRQRYFTPHELCGTYIILTSAAIYDDLMRSEVIISYSSSNDSLYGRYRHGESVHGLFRTNNVAVVASTRPVPCVVAVENAEMQDGTWEFDVAPVDQPFRYPQPENSSPTHHNGGIPLADQYDCMKITFLSSSLIVLGSHFLGHRLDLAPEDGPHVVFGLKVNGDCEDVEALMESWNAIHREYCDWYLHRPEPEDAGPGVDSDDTGHFRDSGDGQDERMSRSMEWDEELIDSLVNQLYHQQ